MKMNWYFQECRSFFSALCWFFWN